MDIKPIIKTSALALGAAAASYTIGAVLAVVFALSPFLAEVEKARTGRR